MNKKKVGIGIGIGLLIVTIITGILIFKDNNTYKVTFNLGDESLNNVVEVKANKTVSKPTDPTKEGYTFEGWYYNGEKFDFSTKITKDIILEARWTSNSVQKWVVTFDSNGGNKIADLNVEDGKIITNIPRPKREGYTFVGWYYNGKKFDFNTIITENITLKAKWNEKEQEVSSEIVKFSVTFNSDGGSKVDNQIIEEGQTVTKPEDPTKEGYTFVGWYYNEAVYDFSTIITSDIELIAKWQKDDVITYKIEETNSYVGQVMLFVLKNEVKVDGIVDVTTSSNKVIKNVEISKIGYMTNKYKIKSIDNIRVK